MIFSRPFGVEEKFGAFSFGMLLGRVTLDYGFQPVKMVEEATGLDAGGSPLEAVHDSQSYLTYGCFSTVKLGYQPAYLVFGLGTYFQNYGTYRLLDGHQVQLSGFNLVPTLGAEVRLP